MDNELKKQYLDTLIDTQMEINNSLVALNEILKQISISLKDIDKTMPYMLGTMQLMQQGLERMEQKQNE